MVQKQQVLIPYWGDGSDNKYYGSSQVFYRTTPNWEEWVSDRIGYYLDGKSRRASVVNFTQNQGTQVFSSSERRSPIFNSCSNRKVYLKCVPYLRVTEQYNDPNKLYGAKYWRHPMPSGVGSLNPVDTALTEPDFADYEDTARRAWWAMQPRFEGEFQALNFIYELKDFRDIAKHVMKFNMSDLAYKCRKLKLRIAHAQDKLLAQSPGRRLVTGFNVGSKTLSDAWLLKQFAIDPTLSDFANLAQQTAYLVETVQQQFFERGQMKNTAHYSEVVSDVQVGTHGTYNNYYLYTGTVNKTLFTATLEYYYKYTLRPWLKAAARFYGFEWSANVVWNMLPLSFLLDYVFKVDQAIGFATRDPNVELREVQYCESLFKQVTQGAHLSLSDRVVSHVVNGDVPLSGKVLLTGVEGTWYIRRVCHPNKGMVLPRLCIPKPKQQLNMAALLRSLW